MNAVRSPHLRMAAAVVWLASAACTSETVPTPPPAVAAAPDTSASRLYVWTGDQDGADADFLAVFDVQSASPQYGRLITTVPVDGRGNFPHHTEYELSPGRLMFANAWGTGRTFLFDLSVADAPRVAGVFGPRGGYGYPHSYARLPNGHVLATFQAKGDGYAPPGAIVELDENGEFIRAASGAATGIPDAETWPYSLLVLPDLDRLITTNTRMGLVSEWKAAEAAKARAKAAAGDQAHAHAASDETPSTHVQVWRLSDLQLLHTLKLPAVEGGHNVWTAEPRRLDNGSVIVNTFSCGLYWIVGLDTARPAVLPIASSRFEGTGYCAVPVVVGDFWIQPSATERAIVAYDLANPSAPREASRLVLDEAFAGPHWIALDPGAPRLVVTSDDAGWMLMLNVDPATGGLSIDEAFREEGASRPGFTFDRRDWPHGAGGRAMPHGAVFAAPSEPARR